MNHELVRFMIVGGLNTANYYILYLICYNFLGWHYMVSHIIGFTISLILSFFLNVYFTYKVKPTLMKFLKFPLTQLVNMPVSSFFVYVFVDLLNWNGNIAPIVAVFLTVPITFVVTSKILKK